MKKDQDVNVSIHQAVRLLKKSRSVFIITGSGVSADSGLPTYRGTGGLYDGKNTEDGILIEVALSGEMLRTRPQVTWKYLSEIEKNCRGAKFNRAHEVIALMEKEFERVCVLTQNIDGFHHDAGSRNIIDIHGDMRKILCPDCGWRCTVKDYGDIKIPPECPDCSSIARPDVVFFGEMLPEDKLEKLQDELNAGFDLYLSIGTTSVFQYISGPMVMAAHLGRSTIEINPGVTEISDIVNLRIPLKAAHAMDTIWSEYEKIR